MSHSNQTVTPAAPVPKDEQNTQIVLDAIQTASKDLPALVACWQSRHSDVWSDSPDLYRALGQRLLKLGEPLLAHDVLAEGARSFPDDDVLKQALALALARSGVPEQALTILDTLSPETSRGEEALGIKARIHKDLWQALSNPDKKRRQLALACEAYDAAYQLTGGYWTGINVATTAFLLDDREKAAQVAEEVTRQCTTVVDEAKAGEDLYWPLATLGEAALILGRMDEAAACYGRAAEAGAGRTGDLASTRRNARLLIEHLNLDGKWLQERLQLPKVLVFSGHMVDRPGRATPRFPAHLEQRVAKEIRNRLRSIGKCIGYASAACGSDILFLEAVLEQGGEVHVVLPYQSEQFRLESVDVVPGSDWKERYERILRQAARVIVASDQKLGDGGVSYQYANLLMQGLASLRAEQLETDPILLTVWDGKRGDGFGGTSSMVDAWHSAGSPVEWIDLEAVVSNRAARLGTPVSANPREPSEGSDTGSANFSGEIRSILFADVVNFSKLREEEIPMFVTELLGRIAMLVRTSVHAPLARKTWGDGLYFVFSTVRQAGLFALELRDLVRKTDWSSMGFRQPLNLRIGLHVGPVYRCRDPITEEITFIGSHVSRTARIEPVTPPGKVYASQPFAALAAVQAANQFKCEYVGLMPLAKGFGTYPTYHVRPVVEKRAR